MNILPTSVRARLAARHGDDADRGLAILELALALPFLIVMAMGVVSYGMAWQGSTDTHSATRAAARVASHDGAEPTADYDALVAVYSALPSKLTDRIEKVIIFKATAADGDVPTACLNASMSPNLGAKGVSNTCNVYSKDQVAAAVGVNGKNNFGTTSSCSGKWDSYWCPKGRNVAGSNWPDTRDYLGVYIQTVYPDITKSIFGDKTIKRSVVFRLEPELNQ